MSKNKKNTNTPEHYITLAQQYIRRSLYATSDHEIKNFRLNAIHEYEMSIKNIDMAQYLLLDKENSNYTLPKNVFIDILFNIGTLYKTLAESDVSFKIKLDNLPKNFNTQYKNEIDKFRKAVYYFNNILQIDFENQNAIKQIVSIYTQLCFLSQESVQDSLNYLNQAMIYVPTNNTIHYNLGHIYHKQNRLELSIIHYNLAVGLSNIKSGDAETINIAVNSYNGISGVYRSIRRWADALYYLQKAEQLLPDDPDIQNQLGVVYTEMRRTDLANLAYLKAIQNYKSAFISKNPDILLADIYLNYGHMFSYNGNNEKSIEYYNMSLQVNPTFVLPFQNKLLNMNYLFNQLEHKMFITNQHKLINKLFKPPSKKYSFNKAFFDTQKINIGIVSGDLIEHPVSYFIKTLLNFYDRTKFHITCYSEVLFDTSLPQFKYVTVKFTKNLSTRDASNMIYKDNIHILLDLSGHTSFNRIDIFSYKPAPIQIGYIGYPFTTGLDQMDYRITDEICDNNIVSQPFYTEKLLFMKNCFLCYDYDRSVLPHLAQQPFLKNNKQLTIGCFNRLNKISQELITLINNILIKYSNIKFVFKTKALINKYIREEFLQKFDSEVRNNIVILDCNLSQTEHLSEYNNIDIAIDTFPYSGTTTSCEALLMGVPVISFYDSTFYFHPQNVTVSLLKNSNLDNYVLENTNDIYKLLDNLLIQSNQKWIEFKNTIRNKFLNGKVCDKIEYIKNISKLFIDVYNEYNEHNFK